MCSIFMSTLLHEVEEPRLVQSGDFCLESQLLLSTLCSFHKLTFYQGIIVKSEFFFLFDHSNLKKVVLDLDLSRIEFKDLNLSI